MKNNLNITNAPKDLKYLKAICVDRKYDDGRKFPINEVIIADNWNIDATNKDELGGFNISVEDKILRWILRGDTLCEVELPQDAKVVEVASTTTPHGTFRTNKMILKNPVKITDEVAMELYLKSDIPEKAYFQILAYLAVEGFRGTCYKIINDKVTNKNIKDVLDIYDNFLKIRTNPMPKLYNEILEVISNMIK